MNNSEIAGRYAKALIELPGSPDEQVQREKAMHQLQNMPLVFRFFNHPDIDLEVKKNVLQKCLTDPTLRNFILLLIEKGKLGYLSSISEKYLELLLAQKKISSTTLITALPVSAETVGHLKERLENFYHGSFVIRQEIDPTIIGGVILIIGNKMIDYSLKGRLDNLKKSLLKE